MVTCEFVAETVRFPRGIELFRAKSVKTQPPFCSVADEYEPFVVKLIEPFCCGMLNLSVDIKRVAASWAPMAGAAEQKIRVKIKPANIWVLHIFRPVAFKLAHHEKRYVCWAIRLFQAYPSTLFGLDVEFFA